MGDEVLTERSKIIHTLLENSFPEPLTVYHCQNRTVITVNNALSKTRRDSPHKITIEELTREAITLNTNAAPGEDGNAANLITNLLDIIAPLMVD